MNSEILRFAGVINWFCVTGFSADKCDLMKNNLIPTYTMLNSELRCWTPEFRKEILESLLSLLWNYELKVLWQKKTKQNQNQNPKSNKTKKPQGKHLVQKKDDILSP